jgi:hypothetical protein
MFQGRYGVLGNDFFSDYLRPELLNYLVIVFYFIYLYNDYLVLCGVSLDVSNVKKTAYRPPVALCTFLRAVKSRFLFMNSNKSKTSAKLALIIKILMIAKLLLSILQLLLK